MQSIAAAHHWVKYTYVLLLHSLLTLLWLCLPGNFYSHLFKDSVDAAKQLGGDLTSAVADIANLHSTFFQSSMPVTLQDMFINSLSHVRWVGLVNRRHASNSHTFPPPPLPLHMLPSYPMPPFPPVCSLSDLENSSQLYFNPLPTNDRGCAHFSISSLYGCFDTRR